MRRACRSRFTITNSRFFRLQLSFQWCSPIGQERDRTRTSSFSQRHSRRLLRQDAAFPCFFFFFFFFFFFSLFFTATAIMTTCAYGDGTSLRQFSAIRAGCSCETSLCPGRKNCPARGDGIGHLEGAGSAARIERYVELSVLVVLADTFSRTIRLHRLQIDSV